MPQGEGFASLNQVIYEQVAPTGAPGEAQNLIDIPSDKSSSDESDYRDHDNGVPRSHSLMIFLTT